MINDQKLLFFSCQFADKFSAEHEKLNVLINNAGCMVNKRELTDEGLEKNFATNTVGTHVLTTKLVPLLSKVRGSSMSLLPYVASTAFILQCIVK